MQLEVLAFWGFLCLIFIALAEMRPQFRVLGILGCILLIPLAFWVWTTGVEIQTGQITTINTTTNTTITSTSTIGTDSTTKSKAPLNLPYADFAQLLATVLFAASIFGVSHYSLNVPALIGRPTMG